VANQCQLQQWVGSAANDNSSRWENDELETSQADPATTCEQDQWRIVPFILLILVNKAASVHPSTYPLARQPDRILIDAITDLLVLTQLAE